MTEALQSNTGVVEDLRDAQETLMLLALSFSLIASPSTHILVARVTAVFAQHTAMAWAELLDDVIAAQGGLPLAKFSTASGTAAPLITDPIKV
ncbi:hypothetical protein [Pseudomonas sp. PB101]|jgi:hypothetical protein|uniref:hypothetical protein n=1 Tax=Pseudomonas sp. PB101 TaxID=2495428 RepID=UPI00273CF912|nr:hypothetical protein [Pseudomonas sp. PB101]